MKEVFCSLSTNILPVNLTSFKLLCLPIRLAYSTLFWNPRYMDRPTASHLRMCVWVTSSKLNMKNVPHSRCSMEKSKWISIYFFSRLTKSMWTLLIRILILDLLLSADSMFEFSHIVRLCRSHLVRHSTNIRKRIVTQSFWLYLYNHWDLYYLYVSIYSLELLILHNTNLFGSRQVGFADVSTHLLS